MLENQFKYGYVVGLLVSSLGDGGDDGRYPDVIASNTKVTFTRTRGQYKKPLESVVNGVKSMLVNHQVVKAAITPEGFITGDIDEARGVALPDAIPGLWLVTGLYKVSLGGFMPDFEIEVKEEHTQESPLDIADYISYVAPAKTPVQTVAIPQGSDGQLMQWDSGEIVWKDTEVLAGPSNTLTIGTVESVPDTPYVDISGESPNQVLSFGLPKGDKGDEGPPGPPGAIANASSYILAGPGRPDTPATTGGIITGQEPVGAEYRSTDGAGVGAWVWMKRPTGWAVADGDTGWRKLPFSELAQQDKMIEGMWTVVRVRRQNNIVYVSAGIQPASGVTGRVEIWTHPNGWRYTGQGGWNHQQPSSLAMVGNANVSTNWIFYNNTNSQNTTSMHLGVSQTTYGVISAQSDQPWPTTLPGTPA